jgi:hypothetical protein
MRNKKEVITQESLEELVAEQYQLFFDTIYSICMSSKCKEEAYEKVHRAFLNGTGGGKSTGDRTKDAQIRHLARLAKIALDESWKLKRVAHLKK